jgi:hypothetical protein
MAVCIALFGVWGIFYERKPHRREHEEEELAQAQKQPERIIG